MPDTSPKRVPLAVIGADGATGHPTERQGQLLAAAVALLDAAPTLRGAGLACAEVNAGLAETQRGYLYLRYALPDGEPQEFWAHVGSAGRINWRTGQVTVDAAHLPPEGPPPPEPPRPARE